jgi:hypothetical protein
VRYVAVSDSTGAKFGRCILRHPIPNSVRFRDGQAGQTATAMS